MTPSTTRSVPESPNSFDRSLWQKLMVGCAIVITFDPIRLFEIPLLQQIPVAMVLFLFAPSFLRRPLAPLHSLISTLLCLLFLYALPGIIYNKLSQETGMFTAITLFLIPISAAYVINRETSVDAGRVLAHAQWIGFAFFFGSLLRLAQDPNGELLWYGIHERSFLLGFIVLPSLLMRYYRLFVFTFATAALILILDFRATTAFCLLNSVFLSFLVLFRIPIGFIILYVSIVVGCLVSAYFGYDLIWELYALVKGAYSNSINDEVRRAAITLAFDEWSRAPILGDFFSGAGAYDIKPYVKWWQGGLIPLHNDYLDFLIRGGIVGISMIVICFSSMIVFFITNIKRLSGQADNNLRILNTFLFVNFINIIFVISFNPILKTVTGAFIVQLIFAWTVALQVLVNLRRENSSYQPLLEATSPGGGASARL